MQAFTSTCMLLSLSFPMCCCTLLPLLQTLTPNNVCVGRNVSAGICLSVLTAKKVMCKPAAPSKPNIPTFVLSIPAVLMLASIFGAVGKKIKCKGNIQCIAQAEHKKAQSIAQSYENRVVHLAAGCWHNHEAYKSEG